MQNEDKTFVTSLRASYNDKIIIKVVPLVRKHQSPGSYNTIVIKVVPPLTDVCSIRYQYASKKSDQISSLPVGKGVLKALASGVSVSLYTSFKVIKRGCVRPHTTSKCHLMTLLALTGGGWTPIKTFALNDQFNDHPESLIDQ